MDLVVQIRLESLTWALATVVFIIAASIAVAHLARIISRTAGLTESEQRKVYWGFLFASPWIIGFVIFVLGPALASFYYSFTRYRLGEEPSWIGLENYRQLLQGEGAHGRRFNQAMFNSLYYAIIGVPLQIAASLGMAMLLNNALKGIRVFRLIFYMPVILAGGPAILLAWRYMLSANGGFINESLRSIANSFFVFDFLYRLFIYVVEGFNGFYAGLTRGNPIGPLKYTLPALIGLLIFVTLVRGDWDIGKRQRARQAAEILGIIVFGALLTGGIVAQPIDLSWTLIWGLVALGGIIVNLQEGKPHLVRAWQYSALGLLALSFIMTLITGEFNITSGETLPYLLAITLAAVPILLSLVGSWNRRKLMLLGGLALLLSAILFVRAVPGQLDGGRLLLVPRYLTMTTALEQSDDLAYLQEVYPEETISSLWIYGLAAVTLVGVAFLHESYPRARQYLLYGAFGFFLLFTLGSALDGLRYFRAFDEIAQTAGTPNFHFALFRGATAVFPDSNRVPLWMSSELWSKPALILITMWSSGAGMLIFLAALKGVPRSLYEAAEVDGANRLQKFFKITLPMISPAMFYNVVIGIIAALQTFETVYILQNPQNQDSLASAAFFLFVRTFQQLAIGQGAAVSWILAVLIVTLTILQFRYSNWVHYET